MNFPCSSVVITSQTLDKISSFYLHGQFVKSALLKTVIIPSWENNVYLLQHLQCYCEKKLSLNWSNRQSDLSPNLHICGAKSEFSKHLLSLFLLCCPISHNYTLKLLPPPTVVYVFSRYRSKPPPAFPATFVFFLFICHSCCLNCLSGSIRLSKQRCSTVPACYKYLWRVSPLHSPHTPLFPFPVSLRSSLLFFLFLHFFSFFSLRYTGRKPGDTE